MLIFADGFDHYTQTNGSDLTNKWTSRSGTTMGINATAGVNGGRCMSNLTPTSGSPYVTKSVANVSSGTVNVAFWFKSGGITAGSFPYIFWLNKLGSSTFVARWNNSGYFNFDNLSSNWDAPNTKIDDGAWHHVEMKIRQSTTSSADNLMVWIDGVLKHRSSNATVNASWKLSPDLLAFALPQSTSYCYMDDFIFWDDTPDDGFDATPLGVRSIYTLTPNGAGSQTELSAFGAAANWSCVTGNDGDTTAVYGLTGTDLYSYSNLPITPTSISAVALNSFVRADTSGSFPLVNKTKSAAAIASSPSVTISGQAYQNIQSAQVKDPNTNSAWTATGLASAEFGITVG